VKAIVGMEYGPPERLELQEIDPPVVEANGVLVRVHAVSVNPLDCHTVRGLPYFARLTFGLRRPKQRIPGVDVAGRVEAVGANVTQFRPDDAVFGACTGGFAEYVCGREQDFVPKPAGLTFAQAAALPTAGCTALQALRDQGRLQPGQHVLIIGAAGGVGTFAVQIAKAFGADVTAVCSTRNVELVRSIGADAVVDYTTADFTRSGRRYDLVVDAVGNRSVADLRSATTPTGTLVLLGAGGGRLLGPLPQLLSASAVSRFVGQRMRMFVAKVDKADLLVLNGLIEAGKVTPVVERTYPLGEAPEALRHLETGHARGKIVICLQA
jgi:NADPH:quinone reductase-like Zn-dependent oxidoreductase